MNLNFKLWDSFSEKATKKAGLGLLKTQAVFLKSLVKNVKRNKKSKTDLIILEKFCVYWLDISEKMIKNPSASEKQHEIDLLDIEKIKKLVDKLNVKTLLPLKSDISITEVDLIPVIEWIDYFEEIEKRYKKKKAEINVEEIKESMRLEATSESVERLKKLQNKLKSL